MNAWFEASAPGRLDVMGGIADYSGSLVLQLPIRNKTRVRISLRDDYQCFITSNLNYNKKLNVELNYHDLLQAGTVDYAHARNRFKQMGKDSWVAYVLGCALVLQHEQGINFTGANFELTSDVPLGKGVSSSASVEVATMKALAKVFDLTFTGTTLPVLAQRVENLVVGAPCGLMDQLATYFGKEDKLLPILCQPDKVSESIPIPSDIFFAGIDSGLKHTVSGAAYREARCAAFMGYSILAQSLGITKDALEYARQHHDWTQLPYQGYLANITWPEFEEKFRRKLPDTLSGKDFLDRYGVSIDPVTSIDEHLNYPVLSCTTHPVCENHRVHKFVELLQPFSHLDSEEKKKKVLQALGTLMFQSHESYSRCGLGSERTDYIVQRASITKGVYGARITGGGQGGTVCLLGVGDEGRESVTKLHADLCRQYDQELALFI
jgi:galactokinase